MKRLLLALVLFAAALTCAACATTTQAVIEDTSAINTKHQSRGVFPFQGESFVFDARHVASKASIADAYLNVGYESAMEDGTRYIPITGSAASKSIIRLFARVDDSAEYFIDPDTWETVYSHLHLNENDRDRQYYVWYFPDEQIASVERHQKEKVVKRDNTVPNGTMGSIPWIFFVRSMALEIGKSYTQYTYDGWTINGVELKVVGEEDVWTENGFYHCQKFEIWRERSDAVDMYGALSGVYIDPARKIHIPSYHLADAWLAMDEYKTPIRLVINTGIGEFDLLLKSYTRQ